MTQLLERAIRRVHELSPSEQDAIAALMLDEVEDEDCWNTAFSGSQRELGALAREALAAHRAGGSEPLEPDRP
jgi:hypothetical protein